MKLKSIKIGISALAGFLFLAGPVLASQYEWIANFTAPTDVEYGESFLAEWYTHTNGTWTEHRSLYYSTNQTDWSEWVQCRKTSTISNGYEYDYCDVNLYPPSTPQTYYVRATTVWNGCSPSSTPNPPDDCGHYQQRTVTVNPVY